MSNEDANIKHLIKIIFLELLIIGILRIEKSDLKGHVIVLELSGKNKYIKKYYDRFIESYLFNDLSFANYLNRIALLCYELYRVKKINRIENEIMIELKEKSVFYEKTIMNFYIYKVKRYILDDEIKNYIGSVEKKKLDLYYLFTEFNLNIANMDFAEFEKMSLLFDDLFKESVKPKPILKYVSS